MADVFISYSRTDISFARKLAKGLAEAGLDTWIDWQDIPPSTDWVTEIHESIEQADAFIFIISKESVDSEVCSREVAFAHENNKRLIPIVMDEIDPSGVPPFIAALNWIFFRESDDFQTSLDRLLEAIHMDQAWVKAHTRLQTRALEWERSDHGRAFLLRGLDLQEAETWLTQAQEKDPHPSDLQRAYIVASRSAGTRQRQVLFGGLGIGLLLALVLSIFAFVQRGVAIEQSDLQATAEAQAVAEVQIRATAEAAAVAERDARATAQAKSQIQRDVAVSQYLAAQSASLTKYQLERKLLLAVEAVRIHPGIEARSSLIQALLAEPYFSGIVVQDDTFVISNLALSQDGTRMAIGSEAGKIRVLQAQSGMLLHNLLPGEDNQAIEQLAFNNDGSTLISVDALGHTLRWSLNSDTPASELLSTLPGWQRFLAISSDGSEIAILTTSGEVAILDSISGEVLQRLEKSTADDHPMRFSPDGSKLAAFGAEYTLHLWDRESGDRYDKFLNLPENSSVTAHRQILNTQDTLAFDTSADRLLFSAGKKTYLWDLQTGEITSRKSSYAAGFNAQGLPMAFSLSMYNPYQWMFEDEAISAGPLVMSIGGDPFGQQDLGYFWSENTEQCFIVWAGQSGGTLIVRYDFKQSTPIRTRIPDSPEYSKLAAVPGAGTHLMITAGCAEPYGLAQCSQGLIQFWDSQSSEVFGDPILAHTDRISGLAVSPNASQFATSSTDGTVQIWDLESRTPLGDPFTLDKPSFIDSLQFHPSGTMLAFRAISENSKASIFLLDLDSLEIMGEPLTFMDGDEADSVLDFAISPDGNSMTVTQQAWILTMWDIMQPAKPALLFSLETEAKPNSIAYRPDGELVAIGMRGASMVINTKTKEVEFTPQEDAIDRVGIYALAYSPDGAWIAALRDDDMVQLMDGASGIPIGAPLPGLDEAAITRDVIAFSADGAQMMAVNQRRDILLWDMDPTLWQETACNMANRNLTHEEWELHLQDIEYRATCPQLP